MGRATIKAWRNRNHHHEWGDVQGAGGLEGQLRLAAPRQTHGSHCLAVHHWSTIQGAKSSKERWRPMGRRQ
ncbi:hypothetical protein E2562_013411 [Oryza meyeriana var. granulata]|uniref:Uncharacterized protein n=1 Tax=Oryza meyeriana var. granulata TaxID=110450 RepID=A0A6G1EB48_9ORYZ|nr:hypothetical protein E2562_013411 [Oryza meyeriana var. granulata]